MNISAIKHELQNILSGKSAVSHGEPIQAITRYLRESLGASKETQRNESSKSEETKKLIDYINMHHFWSCDVQEFMQANGFDNTRNNDYFHNELGIILEDLTQLVRKSPTKRAL